MKEETFQEIIPMIRKIAKKNKLEVIEMRDLFKNEDGKQFQADGVHPSIQGATQMATIISQTLLKDASSAKNSKKKKK
jgi:lysophospholipase L1-like esterase